MLNLEILITFLAIIPFSLELLKVYVLQYGCKQRAHTTISIQTCIHIEGLGLVISHVEVLVQEILPPMLL